MGRERQIREIIKESIEESFDRYALVPYYDDVDLEEYGIDEYEAYDRAHDIAKFGGVTILRGQELSALLVDSKSSKVIGGLWVSNDRDKFSFDIAIDSSYQNMGLSSKLIEAAISEYEQQKEIYGDDFKMEVDVINPKLAKILQNKYGFYVVADIDQNRVLMSIDESKKLVREIIRNVLKEYYDTEVDAPFTTTLPDEIKNRSNSYVGRGVTWYGDPDQMIVLHKSQVEGMWGNVYDNDKFNYLVDLIRTHEDNIEIECSYGIGDVIQLTDIVEHQTSERDGTFQTDYDGIDEPYSLGDEELDEYVSIENLMDFDDMSLYLDDFDVAKVFNENRIYLALGKVSIEEVKEELSEVSDGSEQDIKALNEFIRYEKMLKEALNNKDGDLGTFKVQIRDGHHRVMGAIEAGEEYVCVNLVKEDLEKFKGYYNKVN